MVVVVFIEEMNMDCIGAINNTNNNTKQSGFAGRKLRHQLCGGARCASEIGIGRVQVKLACYFISSIDAVVVFV